MVSQVEIASRNVATPRVVGYCDKPCRWVMTSSVMKAGVACLGSPIDSTIGVNVRGGWMPDMSPARRSNG